MRKILLILLFFLFISLQLFSIPSMAEAKALKEGLYKAEDLNLSPNTTHTIQNASAEEYAFMMIFDSNQITQQLMQLKPNSGTYILTVLQPGYQLLVVTNDEIIIN